MAGTSHLNRIGLVGFDGMAALDLVGVMDAFHIADVMVKHGGGKGYETRLIGFSGEAITAESGLRVMPDLSPEQSSPLDTVVIPGGSGLRRTDAGARIGEWLKRLEKKPRRMVSVCTGLYGLAASGLMSGRRATTHWRYAADAARRFSDLRIEPNAIFIKDGPFYTSAGMTAGIDLALALIEEDCGAAHALNVARQMVVYMKRSGGQLQYSEPLRAQTRAGDRFADLTAAILADLPGDWSVEAMAARTGLSPRQFSRKFKHAFAATPAAHVEMLRLDESRLRLAAGRDGLARIAHAVGFSSDDAFRRAFERRFGVTPSAYRGRFSPAPDLKDQIDEAPRHL